ncbi:conserved hypothetical protein [Coraliomargarita akajimensis DSM 45221]|uniref:Lipoprotein n=1 Tax=Coraliomargarita akajimensis (strain DSM 45221 / IAM 15411 / JCM 23193 / KCTC 12865 / 04OKA010-24) TaxID=583355 RepID=D5EMV1_CORAD|nr:conserved hypothetical protein [Coraliomargarita akajimensis DSM 45221]
MILRSLILALLALTSCLLTGCFNAEQDEQAVPWGRPASWEGGAPGMGGY